MLNLYRCRNCGLAYLWQVTLTCVVCKRPLTLVKCDVSTETRGHSQDGGEDTGIESRSELTFGDDI